MPPEPEPTAYEMALSTIMAVETAEDAQAAYDAVKDDVTAAEGDQLQMAVDNRTEALATAARVEEQKMALMTAAGMVDTSDLSTAEAIAAARTAIAGLEAALAAAVDVSDADKAMYQSQVNAANGAVMTAQNSLDTMGRMMVQRTAIENAVTMARTAVAGVDDASTDSEVAAADNAIAALKTAIEGAVDLQGNAVVASAQGTLTTLEGQLSVAKTSRTAYLDKKAEDTAKAMLATGKALHAALGGNATADTTALDNATASFVTAGLAINAADRAGALEVDPASVTLEAGASVGALGSWNGMDYAHSAETGDAKVTNDARVYTNQGTPATADFGDAHTLTADDNLVVNAENVGLVMAADFTHSGTQTHTVPERSDGVYVRGTYDGAPGEYSCSSGCTSTNDGSGSPSALGDGWTFTPDMGAMVSQPDEHYLYYGWWVSKDSDGNPTAASAFAGRVGTDSGDSTDGLDTAEGISALTGSATYVGDAAGKFAMNNVLDGTGNGGHFTADAELEATFSGDDAGVTGTIDNFRLNDGTEDPGWSVALNNGGLGSSGGSITAPTGDDVLGTVWSINGNEAPASGTWSGTMYDEAVGDDADDGSNIPTTVTGTFYSEFSTIGRIVGAFGADKQ